MRQIKILGYYFYWLPFIVYLCVSYGLIGIAEELKKLAYNEQA